MFYSKLHQTKDMHKSTAAIILYWRLYNPTISDDVLGVGWSVRTNETVTTGQAVLWVHPISRLQTVTVMTPLPEGFHYPQSIFWLPPKQQSLKQLPGDCHNFHPCSIGCCKLSWPGVQPFLTLKQLHQFSLNCIHIPCEFIHFKGDIFYQTNAMQ